MTVRHEIYRFMRQVASEMAEEYQRIQARAKDDPGTAGDEGEESWAELLRNWLPATYPVVTKGRILFEDDTRSPQIDILVLSPHYPQKLRTKKTYFAGGVVAAIECKLTLKGTHIKKIKETSKSVKSRDEPIGANPYEDINSRIIYGVLCHSHGWSKKRDLSDQVFAIMKSLVGGYEGLQLDHARYYPDFVCISDTVTFCYRKTIVWREVADESEIDMLDDGGCGDAAMVLSYDAYWTDTDRDWLHGMVQGTMFSSIIQKMAYFDPTIRPLADYIRRTDIAAASIGWVHAVPVTIDDDIKQKYAEAGADSNAWNPWGKEL